MSTPQTARPSRFMEFITTPWVDKTIAVIAITPNANPFVFSSAPRSCAW